MRLLAFLATAIVAAALVACGGSDGEPPGGGPTPTPLSGPPNVFGRITLAFEPYGEGAVAPEPPYGLEVILRPVDGTTTVRHDVAEDGSFAAISAPGEQEIAGLSIDVPALQDFAFLHATHGPAFDVPEEGCVYVGEVRYSLYRLGPLEIEEQLIAMGEIEDALDKDLELTHIVSGGLVQYDETVAAGERDVQPAECETALAEFREE